MYVCTYVHIHAIHTLTYVRTCADTHRHQTTLDMHRHTETNAHIRRYVYYIVHVLLTLVHPEQRDCGCYQHFLAFQQHRIPHPKCNWEWDLNEGIRNRPVLRRTREYMQPSLTDEH